MGLSNFITSKKNTIDLLIKIYLWSFVMSFLLSINTMVSPELAILPSLSNHSVLNIIFNFIYLILSFFASTFFLGIPIVLLIYKKAFNIKVKIFEKNKISFSLEKFLGYEIIIIFFLVMPIALIIMYFIIGKYSLMYYFVIMLSSFVPIIFIHICVIFYNIITNLKQKERWKKIAINLFLYIILMLYIDRLIIILMKTL